ncbi:hypothetical protein [Synechococcus sp. WH 8020]|uniref:hypothetical protein n=1 Tax=Synechococcus sp. (strain WH8020) TaxID=32052 RepID=UPI000A6E9BA5|nr:hypothetical protein [Synechococcus sp. WH 8020]
MRSPIWIHHRSDGLNPHPTIRGKASTWAGTVSQASMALWRSILRTPGWVQGLSLMW